MSLHRRIRCRRYYPSGYHHLEEWYDTHDVRHEDKEEASKQPWCVLWGFLTQGGLYYISIYRHDEHVHQSHKTLWCRIIHLVVPAPAGWYQDTQQQNDSIDEEHANGLRDGDVERTNLLVSTFSTILLGFACASAFLITRL